MVHPVKTPLGAARAVTHLSLNAVRHPIRTAGDVVTMGRGLVGAVVPGRRDETTETSDTSGSVGSIVESERPIAERAPAEESSTLKRQGDPLTARAGEAAEHDDTTDEAPEPFTAEPFVTEPSAVTGPGDADEIPSPAVQPEDEDTEVITPVGTTGAGPAINPDTTESDLQQPGTEPLMDPATTKRIKREAETLRKASEWRKG